MPDAFEALRAPITPVDPDPAFAAALRAQIDRQLHQGGTRMSVAQIVLDPPSAATPVVAPYLIVRDARGAIDWYTEALGARLRGAPLVMPEGRIGHAELDLGGGVVYLADESPVSRVAAPRPGEPAAVSLTAQVADVDAAVERAVAAGAELERRAADNPYGRNAVIVDPFGHRWILSAEAATSPAPAAGGGDIREGDIAYSSLWVDDVGRARAFFGSVLGWTFSEQGDGRSLAVEGATPRQGLWEEPTASTLFLCYAVPELSIAMARVRAAGGVVERIAEETYGRTADCVDDQGTRFALHQGGAADSAGPRAGHAERRDGDIAYVTLEVRDAMRTRAFYGTVLGWRFTPGRSPGGWNVDEVAPMVGVSGGHDTATAVPMYHVSDIDAAMARVRAAGGTATPPETLPYGITASCTDDQGTRFYLGQLP